MMDRPTLERFVSRGDWRETVSNPESWILIIGSLDEHGILVGRRYTIERWDDGDKNWSDHEAREYVAARAREGSEVHMKAWAIHCEALMRGAKPRDCAPRRGA